MKSSSRRNASLTHRCYNPPIEATTHIDKLDHHVCLRFEHGTKNTLLRFKIPTKFLLGRHIYKSRLGGIVSDPSRCQNITQHFQNITLLVGGFNPSEKYLSNWIMLPGRGENRKHLKPPPRLRFISSIVLENMSCLASPY